MTENDTIRDEYSREALGEGTRGKYVNAYQSGTNVVLLEPDVARAFPDADTLNEALRHLISREDHHDDEAELRKEVYAWFGAAAYHANLVEKELTIARLLHAQGGGKRLSKEDWAKIENAKSTMGSLLVFLREVGVNLGDSDWSCLQDCIEQRNWLIHSFWYDRSHLLVSPQGCTSAIEELETMCSQLKDGNAIAEQISKNFRVELRISEQFVEQIQDEYVRRLKAGEEREAILSSMEERLRAMSSQG